MKKYAYNLEHIPRDFADAFEVEKS